MRLLGQGEGNKPLDQADHLIRALGQGGGPKALCPQRNTHHGDTLRQAPHTQGSSKPLQCCRIAPMHAALGGTHAEADASHAVLALATELPESTLHNGWPAHDIAIIEICNTRRRRLRRCHSFEWLMQCQSEEQWPERISLSHAAARENRLCAFRRANDMEGRRKTVCPLHHREQLRHCR